MRQGRAKVGGAHAAKFTQVLKRGWLLEPDQDLTHPLDWSEWDVRLLRWTFQNCQGQGGVRLRELEWDVVPAWCRPMFGGQGQGRAFAAQVEIGVAPAVQFAGAAQ